MGKPSDKGPGEPDDDFGPDLPFPILDELVPGEAVVWVGYPLSRSCVAQSLLREVVTGIIATALGIGILISIPVQMVRPDLFKAADPLGSIKIILHILFGAAFLAIGIQILKNAYRLWNVAGWTCYVLTERRAIVFAPDFYGNLEVRSFWPSRLQWFEVNEKVDGSGDLVFSQFKTPFAGVYQPVGFLDVPNVRKVEDRFRKTLNLGRDLW